MDIDLTFAAKAQPQRQVSEMSLGGKTIRRAFAPKVYAQHQK